MIGDCTVSSKKFFCGLRRNNHGQLGYGDRYDRGDINPVNHEAFPSIDFGNGRRALQISAGAEHNCALLDDGHVTCWG